MRSGWMELNQYSPERNLDTHIDTEEEREDAREDRIKTESFSDIPTSQGCQKLLANYQKMRRIKTPLLSFRGPMILLPTSFLDFSRMAVQWTSIAPAHPVCDTLL